MVGLSRVVINKEIGETPLIAIERFRKTKSELLGLPLTYAGRLDPMAQGKLLVLIGEECKKRDQYDKLDKEYEFEILLGVKSDSGDILGLIETILQSEISNEARVKKILKSFVGSHELAYPVFSSKTVKGKPLFQYAHENKLDEIEIPKRVSTIYRILYEGIYTLSTLQLLEQVNEKINKLEIDPADTRPGSDFRKDEILAKWGEVLSGEIKLFTVLKIKTIVSSGTYIRTLAPLIAEKLGTIGLAYSIKRTKIGRYVSLTKRFGFWSQSF